MPKISDTGFRKAYIIGFYATVLEKIGDHDGIITAQQLEASLANEFKHKDRKMSEVGFALTPLKRMGVVEKKKDLIKVTEEGDAYFKSEVWQGLDRAKLNKDQLFFLWGVLNFKEGKKNKLNETFEFRNHIFDLFDPMEKEVWENMKKFSISHRPPRVMPSIVRKIVWKDVENFIKPKKPNKYKDDIFGALAEFINTHKFNNNNYSKKQLHYIQARLKKSTYAKNFLRIFSGESMKKNDRINFDVVSSNVSKISNEREIWDAIAKCWDEELINDYVDVNKRWFSQIGLIIKTNDKGWIVNEKFRKLIEKTKLTHGMNKFIPLKYLIENHHLVGEREVPDYPLTLQDALTQMEKTIDEQDQYVDWGIPRHTYYEYIIMLIICKTLNLDSKQFMESIRTNVDSELIPTSHAPGGDSDGVVFLDDLLLLLEVTINKRGAQLRENEFFPCQRHYNKKEIPNKRKVMLIIAPEFDLYDYNLFLSRTRSTYIDDDSKKESKILPLTIKSLCKLINHFLSVCEDETKLHIPLKNTLENVITNIPCSDDEIANLDMVDNFINDLIGLKSF